MPTVESIAAKYGHEMQNDAVKGENKSQKSNKSDAPKKNGKRRYLETYWGAKLPIIRETPTMFIYSYKGKEGRARKSGSKNPNRGHWDLASQSLVYLKEE